MTFRQYAEKLETIKYLAKLKRTGSPQHLAEKFRVSARTIQRMVNQLREHGYPITFNRHRNSYEIKR
ncbi:MAG TPA: HTH domain-containing protein [Chitinophagaceae bacterium]|nr:HTH domain-containing protein [Chitinophagaceae bacterium]